MGDFVDEKNELNLEKSQVFVFTGKIDKKLSDICLSEGQKLKFFKIEELKKIKIVPQYADIASKINIF